MKKIKLYLQMFIIVFFVFMATILTVHANDIGWCSNYDPSKINADEAFSGNSCGVSGTQALDSCLVGHWEIEPDSYRKELETLWAGKPGEIVLATMALEMVIRADGFVQSCVDGEASILMREGAMSAKSPEAQTDVWIKGGGLSFMSMRGQGAFCAGEVKSNVTFKSEIKTMGMTMPNNNIQSKSVLPTEGEFSCSVDRLTITSYPENSDIIVEHTFRRRH